MTDNKDKNKQNWGQLGTIVTDRAAGELRRGLPVVVYDNKLACVLVACEQLTKHSIENMRALATNYNAKLSVLISDKRASTLKIPPKGRVAVLVGLEQGWSSEAVSAVADPTLDLSYPLKGPFEQQNKTDTPLERAALKLLKTAALLPAGVCVIGEKNVILDELTPQEILSIGVDSIENYHTEKLYEMEVVAGTTVPLEAASNTTIVSFRPRSGGIENLAIIIGNPDTSKPVLTRLHSECFTGDLLGSLKCDCGSQLKGAIAEIEQAGGGVLLYLAQEGRGVGLNSKLKAYTLQEQGFDTVDANLRLGFEVDERLYAPAGKMLKLLNISEVELMTNNPKKVEAMHSLGIKVVKRVSHQFPTNKHNEAYVSTKRERTGHLID